MEWSRWWCFLTWIRRINWILIHVKSITVLEFHKITLMSYRWFGIWSAQIKLYEAITKLLLSSRCWFFQSIKLCYPIFCKQNKKLDSVSIIPCLWASVTQRPTASVEFIWYVYFTGGVGCISSAYTMHDIISRWVELAFGHIMTAMLSLCCVGLALVPFEGHHRGCW